MAVRLEMARTVQLARWWWTFIIRGLLAIAFGVLAFFAPGLGVAVLVGLFAAWALIDGATSLVTGIGSRQTDKSWWLEILEGIVSIIAGVIALLFPVLAAEILVIIIAAIRLREQIRGEFWLGLAGLASILFGVILFLFPGVGALSLVWLIGSFALVFGAFLVILGWRLRGVHEMAKIDAAHDYSR